MHLGERDCSLQRRHQKVWEEAGSPALNAQERDEIGGIVTRALTKLGYLGAGTIEFLYEDGQFYFIEMNTRLQVEHPVTEAITGIDIVREQIRIAVGAPAGLAARRISFSKAMPSNAASMRKIHSPSAPRPARSPSSILRAAWACVSIPRFIRATASRPIYDSLAGKLIVHAKNRNECLLRLRRALDELVVGGIETTIPLFQKLVREPDIINGDYSIHWLEKYLASLGH